MEQPMKIYYKLLLIFIIFNFLTPLVTTRADSTDGLATTRTGDGHVTELWQGKVLTARFRAGMCFEPGGKARGVLLLTHSNGQTDPYHLYGTIKNNAFELSHSSGHYFSGRLTGKKSMEGKVRLKSGMKLNLEGERILDVPLLAEDCAPLPEQLGDK